jgi:hypothetical protein
VLLRVWRGPFFPPPVVMDQERLLMFSRTPGRIRKLLRNVSGMPVSSPSCVDTWFVVCGPGSDTREKSAHDRCPVASKFVDSWAWTCADVQQLETLLSRHLGNLAWHESGLGSPACTEELQQTITKP